MEMTVDFPGGARVDAHFGAYSVRTDQPARGGGDASAPTPFDLFLASLATCAGFYVLDFCRRRGISTSDIRLIQRVKTDPGSRLAESVSLEIQLPTGFPEKYRASVVRAAQQCKVKKNLETPPAMEVTARTAGDSHLLC